MAIVATALRRVARSLGVLLCAAMIASSATARADGLVVQRSPGLDCPEAPALSSRIRTFTPRAPAAASPSAGSDETIRVEFGRRGSRLSATIHTTGEKRGTRVLDDEGPSCAALAEATALAIAILVDPEAAAAIARDDSPGAAAPPKPEPPPPPPVEPARDAPPLSPALEPNEPKRVGRGWGLAIHGGAGVVSGLNASIAPLLLIGVEIRPIDLVSVEASMLFAPARGHDLDRGAVDVSLLGGEALGCAWPVSRAGPLAIDAGACVGAAVASVRGEGRGYDADRSASRPWGALDAHLAIRGTLLGPIGCGLRAGVVVPFHRESFGISGIGTAYEMAAVGGASLLVVTAKIR